MKEVEIIPIYQRIRVQLYNDISSGLYDVGKAIPTENSLMNRYDASRTTIRRAISVLVKEGIIERKHGKGMFVIRNVPETHMKLHGTFEDILDIAKNTLVKILRFEYVKPPSEIRFQLLLEESDSVLRIDRARFAENIPFLYCINYLPDEIGRFLSKQDLEKQPVLELLVTKCHKTLKSSFQSFSATVADNEIADVLKVPLGFPILSITRITSSSEDKALSLFLGYFRSDIYGFTAIFTYQGKEIDSHS